MKNKPNVNITLPIFPIFIVFLVLKLTDTIDWSWWWITSPLWIPFALVWIWFILYVIVELLNEFFGYGRYR